MFAKRALSLREIIVTPVHACCPELCQGDRILIPSIDVDERFEGDRITGSWVVDQGSTLLLLLEI